MSFQLSKFTPVLLRSINVRAEMFGSDPVPAVDLGFRLTGSNDLLRMFDAGLIHAFYMRADDHSDDEPELEGVDPITNFPQLRSTSIDMPILLIREYVGLNLVLDFGLGGKSNIGLFGDADHFKVNMVEGGSVEIDFRFQSSGVKGEAIGKLGELVKHEVKITLMPSAAADGTQEQIPTTKPKVHSGDAPKPDATDLFVAGAAPADPKADAKAARQAEKDARFPSAAKRVAAKNAASKKVVPFKKAAAKKAVAGRGLK